MIPALHKARHFYLLMGFFSCYCGFLYNDFSSMPVYLFDSCYEYTFDVNQSQTAIMKASVSSKDNCVYSFGIDPAWFMSSNVLTFTNSLKMKIAVILGVFQMTLGILMRGLNNLYFKEQGTLSFVFEFIP